jgi:hypothetical protein
MIIQLVKKLIDFIEPSNFRLCSETLAAGPYEGAADLTLMIPFLLYLLYSVYLLYTIFIVSRTLKEFLEITVQKLENLSDIQGSHVDDYNYFLLACDAV